MYRYQNAVQATEGQHWSEFGSQLYVSAYDERDTASRLLARQLECTAHSIPHVQPQLTLHSSHAAQQAQRLPGTRYPSRVPPSCPQMSGSVHDHSLTLAATSAYRPTFTSQYQPARQLSASDPQWLSPCSRSFVARRQNQADKQGLKSSLETSCLPAGKSSHAHYAFSCKVTCSILQGHVQENAAALQRLCSN